MEAPSQQSPTPEAPEAPEAPSPTAPPTSSPVTEPASASATTSTVAPSGETPMPKLLPGRIVYYVLPKQSKRAGEIRPAMVVKVHTPYAVSQFPATVALNITKAHADDFKGVLADAGTLADAPTVLISAVPYDARKSGGSWHWPSKA